MNIKDYIVKCKMEDVEKCCKYIGSNTDFIQNIYSYGRKFIYFGYSFSWHYSFTYESFETCKPIYNFYTRAQKLERILNE